MNTLEDGRSLAARIRNVQLVVFAVLCLLSGLVDGVSTVTSIALGALTVMLPQALFALYALRREASELMILSRLLQGELVKLSATVILIYLSLIRFSIEPVLFFCSYAIGLIASWLTALMSTKPQPRAKSA